MNSSQIIDKKYSLLLNLLLRETKTWYFFDIPPKYDSKLLSFMLEVSSDCGYIRYELSKNNIIYFPLVYRSLVGMHIFNARVAVRKSDEDNISLVNYEDVLQSIIKETFSISKGKFNTVIPNIEKLYFEFQEKSFQQFVAEKSISDLSLSKVKYFPNIFLSKELFTEYKTAKELSLLSNIISSFAEKSNLTESEASLKWVSNYTNVLFESSLELFTNKGFLVNSSLYYTTVYCNEEMLPSAMCFNEGTPNVLVKELSNVSLSNLTNNFKSQLICHHIYALIRCVGILKFSKEKELLDVVTEAVYKFSYYNTNNELVSFENVHNEVVSYLPLIFEIETNCSLKQVHIHNYLNNKKYYSHDLIKPNPREVVHKRYFNEGTMEIAIRGFDINTDLETLHEWVNLEYTKKFWEMDGPIEELEREYIKHLGVDYSHPYIGTLDGEPIFTLELYWAVKDIVGKYYPFHPGDYGFHMLIAPAKKRIPNFSYYALTMCMEHFFSYSQVHRMIGEASSEHMGTHNLITKVGCEFDKALVLPYKTSNLTFLTREMYYDAVKDALDESTKEKT